MGIRYILTLNSNDDFGKSNYKTKQDWGLAEGGTI
jgi:hypothetical protein